MTEDQVADGAAFELERDGGSAGEATGHEERFERSAEEQQNGVRMDEMIEETHHLYVVGALFAGRERLRVTRGDTADAAKFGTAREGLRFQVGWKKHFLQADGDVTTRFNADANHFANFPRSARRRFFDPGMSAGPHTVDGEGGKNGQVLGIVAGNDKNQFRLFRRKHLMVIRVGPLRPEKSGAIPRPLRMKVADRHEVHRCEGECGIDVSESVTASADEADAQFAAVFVIVSNVLDNKDVPELFADGLAIR